MREYRRVEVGDREALRRWLRAHHEQADPVWLVTAKKSAGAGYIPYGDIVEEALAFGWVDSLPRKLDATRSMLLLSTRKPGSAWSRPNRERVERLIASGRMTPAGQAKVDAAKADGSWLKLAAAERGETPPDLAAALADAGLTETYAALSAAVKRRVIEHVSTAKRPATRAARIEKVVAGTRTDTDPLRWRPRA